MKSLGLLRVGKEHKTKTLRNKNNLLKCSRLSGMVVNEMSSSKDDPSSG